MGKKISRGISIEEAARQTGIPIDEVYIYVSNGLKQVDTLNFQLRLIGQGAIRNALTKLTELAAGTQRASETEETVMGDAGPERTVEKLRADDLDAAKALAKFGIDALKLAQSGKAPRDDDKTQKDLFDVAENPWELKEIE